MGRDQGPEQSFEEIVAAHQEMVWRLARRLLAWPEDVDDVVQEVFLRVLRNLGQFRGESRVESWLWRITVNTCRSWQRGRAVRLRLVHRAAEQGGFVGAAAAEVLLDREEARRVREAVAALPQKYREVVVLRYLEGLAVKEVAEVLGLTPTAVGVRLSRAREKLRRKLGALMEEPGCTVRKMTD